MFERIFKIKGGGESQVHRATTLHIILSSVCQKKQTQLADLGGSLPCSHVTVISKAQHLLRLSFYAQMVCICVPDLGRDFALVI